MQRDNESHTQPSIMVSMPLQVIPSFGPSSTFYPFTTENYFNFALFPTFYIP
jgi:hypothetical protein